MARVYFAEGEPFALGRFFELLTCEAGLLSVSADLSVSANKRVIFTPKDIQDARILPANAPYAGVSGKA